MKNWNVIPISSLGNIVTGKTPPKANPEYWDGNELFISPKDMERDSFYIKNSIFKITKKALNNFKTQRLPKNSVMYTILSYGFGKIGLAYQDLLTNQQITSIVVNNKNDYRFVYYLLRTNTPHIFAYNSGIDTPIVPKSVFEKIKLLIPPLPVQKKIAAILSSYDELIENNNRRIAILEKMAEEIYKEWFVRMRFPGHKKTKFVKGLPEGWEVKPIVNIDEISFIKEKLKPFDGKKNYYATADVNGITLGKPTEIISYNSKPSRAQYLPVINSVWFARMKNTYKILTFSEINSDLVKSMVLSSGFAGFKTSRDFLPYLFCLIKSKAFHEAKDLYTTGATQESLTNSGLSKIKVICPVASLIKKFSIIQYESINMILNLQKINKKLKQSRDLLLPRLISGKLDVENLDIAFPSGMRETTKKQTDTLL